ncbi:MAG: DUF445 domain-containing protein, partial [Caulobacteraceae bacterium]
MTGAPGAGAERERAQKARLARMRLAAGGLLLFVTALFILSRALPRSWPWPPWLGAFSEAAMVGALADWFAVTALFRRPFGLPIPHTAIVAANKDRLGRALGAFIAGNFLTPRLVDQRLRAFRPSEKLSAWLLSEGAAAALASQIAGLLAEAVRGAEGGEGSGVLLDEERISRLLDGLIGRAEAALKGHAGTIKQAIAAKTWPWLPRWVDDLIAGKALEGLGETLRDLHYPDHPWRRAIGAWAAEQIAALAGEKSELASAIERLLIAGGRRLAGDSGARARLDGLARVAARRLLTPRRQAIGEFIAGVVAGWNAADAAERLELQVGAELQYIRINGTIVGGMAGLAIYALA